MFSEENKLPLLDPTLRLDYSQILRSLRRVDVPPPRDILSVETLDNWRRVNGTLSGPLSQFLPSSAAVKGVASEDGTCETCGLHFPIAMLEGTQKSVLDHPSPSVQSYLTACSQQSPPLHGKANLKRRPGRGGRFQCDECRKAKKGWKVKLLFHFSDSSAKLMNVIH
jgi:hypothetical protein